MHKWQCRVAPSLGGGFERTPYEAWNCLPYKSKKKRTVFMGLYGMPDLTVLLEHEGEKVILWCGSDIRHFINGYWLDNSGKERAEPQEIARFLTEIPSYVENQVEYEALKAYGIESIIVPSFLGDVAGYEIAYTYRKKPKVYTSVSGDDFELYGWTRIPNLARENPDVEFHLYGNSKHWKATEENIVVHGRVPIGQMIRETKGMQGALRLTEFEGFSEILARSLLWGQYPISQIPYPYTLAPMDIESLKQMKSPNAEGRDYYKQQFNNYPFNVHLH